MENVILTVHLLLALLLIGVVLLQRSEGGGLGMGGGGGGVMTARGAANALTKLTWIFAACFIATSVTLTFISAKKAGSGSVVDQAGLPTATAPADPAADASKSTLPAPTGDLLPPVKSDVPATPPASN